MGGIDLQTQINSRTPAAGAGGEERELIKRVDDLGATSAARRNSYAG